MFAKLRDISFSTSWKRCHKSSFLWPLVYNDFKINIENVINKIKFSHWYLNTFLFLKSVFISCHNMELNEISNHNSHKTYFDIRLPHDLQSKCNKFIKKIFHLFMSIKHPC